YGSTDQLVTFGWNPAGDNYRLNIRPDPWNDVVFSKVVNQEREDLVHLEGIPNQHHQWHHIAVVFVQAEIIVYFDDEELFTYHDLYDPLLQGKVGVMSYSGGVITWQDAYFDNVSVVEMVVASESRTWSELKLLYR
ncbi:MAG: hypothetical protein KAS77_12170, partial [Thermoplasmata archaeon]|nr:hypothetical protein [Thermoplasmata archaeon]